MHVVFCAEFVCSCAGRQGNTSNHRNFFLPSSWYPIPVCEASESELILMPLSGLFRAVGGDTVTVSLYSGHGSGLDGFGQPVRFIWADFQAKPSILDPFWTKFDVFGTYRNFGWDLTSPVLLCTIPAGAFFP